MGVARCNSCLYALLLLLFGSSSLSCIYYIGSVAAASASSSRCPDWRCAHEEWWLRVCQGLDTIPRSQVEPKLQKRNIFNKCIRMPPQPSDYPLSLSLVHILLLPLSPSSPDTYILIHGRKKVNVTDTAI